MEPALVVKREIYWSDKGIGLDFVTANSAVFFLVWCMQIPTP